MASTYEIYPREQAIVTRYFGTLTLQELVVSAQSLWADPRYSREYCGIADLSDVSLGVAMCDFRAMLDFLRQAKALSTARWAAVTGTPLTTACAMIYRTAMSHRHPFELFPTWSAACEFLQLKLPVPTDGEPASTGATSLPGPVKAS